MLKIYLEPNQNFLINKLKNLNIKNIFYCPLFAPSRQNVWLRPWSLQNLLHLELIFQAILLVINHFSANEFKCAIKIMLKF